MVEIAASDAQAMYMGNMCAQQAPGAAKGLYSVNNLGEKMSSTIGHLVNPKGRRRAGIMISTD